MGPSCVLGVDLGRTQIRATSADRNEHILCEARELTRAAEGPEAILGRIKGRLRNVLEGAAFRLGPSGSGRWCIQPRGAIVPASLGDRVGLLGAVAWAFEQSRCQMCPLTRSWGAAEDITGSVEARLMRAGMTLAAGNR